MPADPIFLFALLVQFLPVLNDLRDRNTATYREFFDFLVADIREHGILVPLIGYYEGEKIRIIDGMTRFLAAVAAGVIDKIPVLVFLEKPDEGALKLSQVTVNALRQDLTPLEYAAVFVQLKELHGWSSDAEVARHVHKSRGEVSRIMSISSRLCPQAQELVKAGKLVPKGAYFISMLPDAVKQMAIASNAENMSAETIWEKVQIELGGKKPKAKKVNFRVKGGSATMTNGSVEAAKLLIAELQKWLRGLSQ